MAFSYTVWVVVTGENLNLLNFNRVVNMTGKNTLNNPLTTVVSEGAGYGGNINAPPLGAGQVTGNGPGRRTRAVSSPQQELHGVRLRGCTDGGHRGDQQEQKVHCKPSLVFTPLSPDEFPVDLALALSAHRNGKAYGRAVRGRRPRGVNGVRRDSEAPAVP